MRKSGKRPRRRPYKRHWTLADLAEVFREIQERGGIVSATTLAKVKRPGWTQIKSCLDRDLGGLLKVKKKLGFLTPRDQVRLALRKRGRKPRTARLRTKIGEVVFWERVLALLEARRWEDVRRVLVERLARARKSLEAAERWEANLAPIKQEVPASMFEPPSLRSLP